MHSEWFEPTSPAVLARAIRSLLGDHAIHSTGLGSCFSPTCRKAGMFLAGKYRSKTEELIRINELNNINILTCFERLSVSAFDKCSSHWRWMMLQGPNWTRKVQVSERITLYRYSYSVVVIDQQVVSNSTRLVFSVQQTIFCPAKYKIHILIAFPLLHWRRHISSLTNHRTATEADERKYKQNAKF